MEPIKLFVDDVLAVYEASGAEGLRAHLHDAPNEFIEAMVFELAEMTCRANRVGAVCFLLGQFSAARDALMEALQEHHVRQNRLMEAHTRYQLSRVYMRLGNMDKAILHAERARALPIEHVPKTAAILMLLAQLYQHTQRNREARAVYEEVLPLTVKLDRRDMEALVCLKLHWLVETSQAIELLERAARLFEITGDPMVQQIYARLDELTQ